jgi:predicted membrane-bound spermidine synthase
MKHELKPIKLDQITWLSVKAELLNREFWSALAWATLWSILGIGLVYAAGHVLRWQTQIHELLWFIVLPFPAALIFSQFAGWYHQSRRVLWISRMMMGGICVLWIPLAIMGCIIGMGLAGIR